MGYRSSCDPLGNNLAGPIDRMLGTAFRDVKEVSDQLDTIRFVAINMAALLVIAEQYAQLGANTDFVRALPTVLRTPDGLSLNALPNAATRENSVLSFDGAGQPITQTLLAMLTTLFTGLPTALPAQSGVLWLNGGVLCVS